MFFEIIILTATPTNVYSRLEVCGSTRTRGYTRTPPVPAGMGRVPVDVLRVGSGTGTKSTGTGIPVFTRKEHHFHDVGAISNVFFLFLPY